MSSSTVGLGGNFLSPYDGRIYNYIIVVKSAVSYMPRPVYRLPYEGAREMIFVNDVDDKDFLTGLFNAMYDELPPPKSKKKK